MISAYKRNAGESCLKAENEFFNTKMSSARFKSEHCIGLIKNRFSCLRGLNVRIKKPRDVKKVVQNFTACIILHNLLCQSRTFQKSGMKFVRKTWGMMLNQTSYMDMIGVQVMKTEESR